jgi:hypothetical protein
LVCSVPLWLSIPGGCRRHRYWSDNGIVGLPVIRDPRTAILEGVILRLRLLVVVGSHITRMRGVLCWREMVSVSCMGLLRERCIGAIPWVWVSGNDVPGVEKPRDLDMISNLALWSRRDMVLTYPKMHKAIEMMESAEQIPRLTQTMAQNTRHE